MVEYDFLPEVGMSRCGILDDLIVSRFEEDRYLAVCNASNRDKIALASSLPEAVDKTNS